MSTKIFVNLPVKDLSRSKDFFTQLGFSFNTHFTNDRGACMIVSEDIFVMLLVERFFKTFTNKQVADASKTTETILALSAGSREEVDELVSKALKAGATVPHKKQDQGWMYGHGFQDLDGHLWETIYMDPNAIKQN
ncbi:VOC family protein [Agriterribacter sp.]|uniref:VOC family protein n=1 Tax=Agriterribacter sp. TaxID=2821509 RepID=UPI002CB47B50|nr:VOC family protein [Agriterribacter sp.]HTN09281.1 VOC family protein [Agriterribacter sp.]